MFRTTNFALASTSSSVFQVLKKFKLAGAHPDILAADHPEKATMNGESLIQLETVLQDRANPKAHHLLSTENTNFEFWVKSPQSASTPSNGSGFSNPIHRQGMAAPFKDSAAPSINAVGGSRPGSILREEVGDTRGGLLKRVSCSFTPTAPDHVIQSALRKMFQDSGILENFHLHRGGGGGGIGSGQEDTSPSNMEEAIQSARHTERNFNLLAGNLLPAAESYLNFLRQWGVAVGFQAPDNTVYLMTEPEELPGSLGSGGALQSTMGNPLKNRFLEERGLKGFDFRLITQPTAVERLVLGLEKLTQLYNEHRGSILRKNVFYILSSAAPPEGHRITRDGCILLSLQTPAARWDEHLLCLSTEEWRLAVEYHLAWRIGGAPRLEARKRILVRAADMFGFQSCKIETKLGQDTRWAAALETRLKTDEATIRGTINKYGLKQSALLESGVLTFKETLRSVNDASKEIGFFLDYTGHLTLSSQLTTGQMLKTLKTSQPLMIQRIIADRSVMEDLERLSRRLKTIFSIDFRWKDEVLGQNDPAMDVHSCVSTFIQTAMSVVDRLQTTLRTTSGGKGSGYTFLISDRFGSGEAGTVIVPWDCDADRLTKAFLAR